MLQESGLMEEIENRWGALHQQYLLYGDKGYPLKPNLITPFTVNRLTPAQQQFNTKMSKLRICVEWEFGEIFEQFAFLDFKKNQKIFLQPVAKYMKVAAILKNCQTCLYGSETSSYFEVDPPSLESYIKNDPTL